MLAVTLLLLFISSPLIAVERADGVTLLAELGCGSCHPGLFEADAGSVREKAPDLSDAGLRYNPAYLFDYLQRPVPVRHQIGRARMPDFHLSEKESLALALFLEQQKRVVGDWPDFPEEVRRANSTAPDGRAVIQKYECTKCHRLGESDAEKEAVDLHSAGYRLNEEWLKQYLVAPYIFDGEDTKMPTYFYDLRREPRAYIERVPKAAEEIAKISELLMSLSKDKRQILRRNFAQAKEANPEVTADLGEKIFRSQNCVACHKFSPTVEPIVRNAPDLSLEGARVQKKWLVAYLKKPTAVRPFGYHPGSGSRMPDFNLTDEEATVLADYLFEQSRALAEATDFVPKRLSPFAMDKVKTLLQEKLACLGCHRLGTQGGRIGPDLSNLKSRLQSGFVYRLIRDPQAVLPETIMPKIAMPPETLELVVDYLLQQEVPPGERGYLSLVEHPIYFPEADAGGRALYVKYCASCHGINGEADGFNARYLPQEPTRHSDSAYLSERADDTLFDGIFAGGYVLNKSPNMPPWGQTLNHTQIRHLVTYIRELCDCVGPAWSLDNN